MAVMLMGRVAYSDNSAGFFRLAGTLGGTGSSYMAPGKDTELTSKTIKAIIQA
jgi:hypothetical protein